MDTLLTSSAVELVRKNLDELDPNASVMYTDENSDNASLDDIIKRNLPEAINAVHLAAPVSLLEGESVSASALDQLYFEDGVFSFRCKETKLLRLVAFQMADSPIVLTDIIPEASPEGRKQLNSYIRGTFDRPRLVRKQGITTSYPSFRYYCIADGTVPNVSLSDKIYLEQPNLSILTAWEITYPGGSTSGTSAAEYTILGKPYFVIPIPPEYSGSAGLSVTLNNSASYSASIVLPGPIVGSFNNNSGIDFHSMEELKGDWLASNDIETFLVIKRLSYVAPTDLVPDPSYNISGLLRQNIIDYLTAVVMDTYADQRSQIYYQKASNYIAI